MEALEEQDDSNGQVSGAKIKELLELFQGEVLTGVEQKLQTIQDSGFLPQENQENIVFHDPDKILWFRQYIRFFAVTFGMYKR